MSFGWLGRVCRVSSVRMLRARSSVVRFEVLPCGGESCDSSSGCCDGRCQSWPWPCGRRTIDHARGRGRGVEECLQRFAGPGHSLADMPQQRQPGLRTNGLRIVMFFPAHGCSLRCMSPTLVLLFVVSLFPLHRRFAESLLVGPRARHVQSRTIHGQNHPQPDPKSPGIHFLHQVMHPLLQWRQNL